MPFTKHMKCKVRFKCALISPTVFHDRMGYCVSDVGNQVNSEDSSQNGHNRAIELMSMYLKIKIHFLLSFIIIEPRSLLKYRHSTILEIS
jgi:hypothetical protein